MKDLKDQFIEVNVKLKYRLKVRQIDIFWNLILLELMDYHINLFEEKQ